MIINTSLSRDRSSTNAPRRSLARLAAAFAMLGSLFSAGTGNATDLEVVKVGGASSMLYTPFYIAMDQGFFEEHGLKIDWVNMINPSPALISGDISCAPNGSDSAVIAASRGRPTPAVVMLQQRNSLSIFSAPGLNLPNQGKPYPENVKDLRGKTIGISGRGGGGETFARLVMSGAGMQEGPDYSMVVIGNGGQLVGALKAKQIDAAMLWPPYGEQARAEKAGNAMVEEAKGEGPALRTKAVGISIQCNAEFLASKPETAKKFIAAVVKGAEFYHNYAANKTTVMNIVAKYTGVSDRRILDSALETGATLSFPGIDCEAWANLARGLAEVGSVPSAPLCAEMVAQDLAPKGPLQ